MSVFTVGRFFYYVYILYSFSFPFFPFLIVYFGVWVLPEVGCLIPMLSCIEYGVNNHLDDLCIFFFFFPACTLKFINNSR